jgi:hypothetical protein
VILLYGDANDPTLRSAQVAAFCVGVDCRVVEQAHLRFHGLQVRLEAAGTTGWLMLAGERISFDRIDGVFARPLELPHEPLFPERARAFHRDFMDWLDITDFARVANRPGAMQSNLSKPYQAQLIAAVGFTVPETLVTNDPDEVRSFQRAHGRVIFKSISGIRSIVAELDETHTARLEQVRLLPTQFQAHVPGDDVRVHVVGTEVFATEVRSAATDYRYAARSGDTASLRTVELPDTVAERCVTLTAALGLTLSGIDLRRRPDGEYVCFEANPMPAYRYYEANTGQPISGTLIRLLAGN